MFAARAVLIDLDGTLIDSLPDIAMATNSMLRDCGRAALPPERIATYIGRGVDVLVHRALTGSLDGTAPEPAFASARQAFNRHYGEVNGTQSRVFPGVDQALQLFRDGRIAMACVTNKPRAFTEILLRKTGLIDAFDALVTGDDTQHKKPHAEPMHLACRMLAVSVAESTVIGDSENDVQSARAAGCRVILVETGYNEGRPLAGTGADAIVPTLLDAAHLIVPQPG